MFKKSFALILLVFQMTGCAVNSPPVVDRLEAFNEERTFDEYLRKAAIWLEYVDDEVVWMGSGWQGSYNHFNVKQEGIDREGFVKQIGDYIVLLQEDNLYSFSIPTNHENINAIDYFDLVSSGFGSGDDESYYGFVHSGNSIVVRGFNSSINARLIRIFNIDDKGSFSEGSTYYFKRSDYWDTSDFGYWFINERLIIVSQRDLRDLEKEDRPDLDVSEQLLDGEKTIPLDRIYYPVQQESTPLLLTVATCDIESKELDCIAANVVIPKALGERISYVSDHALYLWVNALGNAYDFFNLDDDDFWRLAEKEKKIRRDSCDSAVLYRIPFDGSAPGAVNVQGWPVDSFSFRETESELQVFALGSRYEPKVSPALITIQLEQFSEGLTAVSESQYTYLPPIKGYSRSLLFAGSHLLYNDTVYAEDSYEYQESIWVKDLESDQPPKNYLLEHHVHEIMPLNNYAVLIGTNDVDGLGITSLDIGSSAELVDLTWIDRGVLVSYRGSGLNYLDKQSQDIFALSLLYAPDDEPYEGVHSAYECPNMHIAYFSFKNSLKPEFFGELSNGKARILEDDDDVFSCSDTYLDSHPFFINEKPYALLGHELVEGYFSEDKVRESRRIDTHHFFIGSQ